MALLNTITCTQCGNLKEVCHSASDYPTICSDCESLNANTIRNAHLAVMKQMPLEDRIARIEAILYDMPAPRDSWQDMRIG